MENDYGGPVWHVSASPQTLPWGPGPLERIARQQLEGAGAADLGEWPQWTGRAFHLRRRLSVEEAGMVGPVVDVRGTFEAEVRLRPVRHLLPEGWAA